MNVAMMLRADITALEKNA